MVGSDISGAINIFKNFNKKKFIISGVYNVKNLEAKTNGSYDSSGFGNGSLV